MSKKCKTKKNLVILGKNWLIPEIIELIQQYEYGEVIAVFPEDPINDHLTLEKKKIKLYQNIDRLFDFCKDNYCQQIIITGETQNKPNILKQLVKCQELGIEILNIYDLYAETKKTVPIKHVDNKWLSPSLMKRKPSINYLFLEVIDYLCALILLLLSLFILPFIAFAIKLDSKGPILYIQERVGLNGKTFKMLKFRTMVDKADTMGSKWTISGDERITRVGKFLRKFRLDEIPQIINVLKQDMNLVGPRPEAKELVDHFEEEIPFYHYRHLAKPGITGWAQVNYRNTSSVDGAIKKLEYDLFWVKNRSVGLLIQTILKTIKVVLTGFGSV